MTDVTPNADYENETVETDDPVRRWLLFAIAIVVVAILALVVFALVSGLFARQAPRTATEARLVTLKNAAEGAPGSGAAQRDYIEALIISGQYGAARDHIEIMKEQLAGVEVTHVYVAELGLLLERQDYDGLLDAAEEAYDYEIAQQDAWVEEQVAAGRSVDRTLLAQDNVIAIQVYRARAAGGLGEVEAGVEYLSEAVELDPSAADLLVLRGEGYAELGDTEAARADFEQALIFIPDFQPALDGLNSLDGQ